jgi:hypothetical protein
LPGDVGYVGLGERLLLEKSGEEQVHEVGGQAVNRLVGRQINAVEVVDAPVFVIGREEGALDVVERHGFPEESPLPDVIPGPSPFCGGALFRALQGAWDLT